MNYYQLTCTLANKKEAYTLLQFPSHVTPEMAKHFENENGIGCKLYKIVSALFSDSRVEIMKVSDGPVARRDDLTILRADDFVFFYKYLTLNKN